MKFYLICLFFTAHLVNKNSGAPSIDSRINAYSNGETMRVLVTLKEYPDLSIAENATGLYQHIKQKAMDSLGPGAMATFQSFDSFATTDYRNEQGKYVHSKLKEKTESKEKFKQMLNQRNAKVIKQFFISNTFLIEISKAQLNDLLKDANDLVDEVFIDKPFTVPLGYKAKENLREQQKSSKEAVEWNIRYIKADEVWKEFGASGFGTVYANADTGVDYTHPALKANYLGCLPNGDFDHNYAWWDSIKENIGSDSGVCGINSPKPCDDNGHGTHTTSTAVGREGLGVAPGARWMACRNMDRGVGSSSTYLSCLEFFLAPTDLNGNNPRPEKRPHVIGNSYGCPTSEGCAPFAFNAASRALKAAGILMSVSAGNNGPICASIDTPPAFESLVFTVGALTYKSNKIAPFSSRGPVIIEGKEVKVLKPDFVAPGVRIRGAIPGGQYALLSGTSMASPHLSGLLLMISEVCSCLERQIDDIYTVLMHAAKSIRIGKDEQVCGSSNRNSVPNSIYGYGMIDALKTIRMCMEKCVKK